MTSYVDIDEILMEDTGSYGLFEDAGGDVFGFVETEDPFDDVGGFDAFDTFESEHALSEAEVQELAYELMALGTEAEFEEFLGKLFKKVGRRLKRTGKKVSKTAGRIAKSPAGQILKKALPIVGTAVGSALAPGIGTQIGGAAGSILGSVMGGDKPGAGGFPLPGGMPGLPGPGAMPGIPGMGGNPLAALFGGGGNPLAALLGSGLGGNVLGQLLGGSFETASLEAAKTDFAKRIIRTVADGTAKAATDPRADANPAAVARAALGQALRKNIPVPLRAALIGPEPAGVQGSGQWVRRGNQIILMGA